MTRISILILVLVLALSLFAQSSTTTITASMTGTGQTITGDLVIPLAPSTLTWACAPAVLQKGGTVSCVPTLDSAVPAGMTGTVTLGTPPTGFTVTPSTSTIPAGATTGPAVTVTRQ
jgi:hypothetical protein